MADTEAFWRNIEQSGYVIDPERLHHEFNQGLHGQKADFDNIEEGTELFEQWIDVTVDFIQEEYSELPDAVVGVANGTNRVAKPVAKKLGNGTIFLETEKQDASKPVLTKEAKLVVEEFQPIFALIIEDVGTRGTNAVSAANSTLAAGVSRIEVLNTFQRAETLPLLDEAGIVYKSMVKRLMPNFTPDECRTLPEGFCRRQWRLIPYGAQA